MGDTTPTLTEKCVHPECSVMLDLGQGHACPKHKAYLAEQIAACNAGEAASMEALALSEPQVEHHQDAQ